MQEVLEYYSTRIQEDHFEFIKKCFYLRYELKMMSKKQTQKDEMAGPVFKKYKIDRQTIYALNEFDSWNLDAQVDFGGLMFEYVTEIYRDIIGIHQGMRGYIAPDDLTIIGRKLDASMSVKDYKVPILHISSENIKLPAMTFLFKDDIWQVFASHDPLTPIIANEDMVFCLAYIVWNGIFDPHANQNEAQSDVGNHPGNHQSGQDDAQMCSVFTILLRCISANFWKKKSSVKC